MMSIPGQRSIPTPKRLVRARENSLTANFVNRINAFIPIRKFFEQGNYGPKQRNASRVTARFYAANREAGCALSVSGRTQLPCANRRPQNLIRTLELDSYAVTSGAGGGNKELEVAKAIKKNANEFAVEKRLGTRAPLDSVSLKNILAAVLALNRSEFQPWLSPSRSRPFRLSPGTMRNGLAKLLG